MERGQTRPAPRVLRSRRFRWSKGVGVRGCECGSCGLGLTRLGGHPPLASLRSLAPPYAARRGRCFRFLRLVGWFGGRLLGWL